MEKGRDIKVGEDADLVRIEKNRFSNSKHTSLATEISMNAIVDSQ